jgi:HemY protein
MRALPALIVIALLVAASVYVADRPGSVDVVWQGWRIDTSVAVLVLAVVALAMAAAALFHILRKVLGGPRAFMRSRRDKRRREGYRALTQGMVAVAAGDAAEAQKFARKADVLLAEPPLTLLLSAQAAQLNGDDQAAHRYFSAMIERKETEFLGLRGLIMQALRSGDEGKALSLIERAKALRPSTPWVLSSLFELQARAGKWHEAEATLVEATKRKALPQAESRHRQAVLLHEKSHAAEAKGETREALEHAAKAHKLDPGFAPVTTRYADLLRAAGKPRPAAKAIEAGWRAQPHPDLAEAYDALAADEPPMQHLKTVERLAAHNPDHRESRIALAAAALKARLWGEARRHLEAAGAASGDSAPTPRICRLMAELEQAEHDNHAAGRAW